MEAKGDKNWKGKAGLRLLPGWCRVQHDMMIDARNTMKKIRPKESRDLQNRLGER